MIINRTNLRRLLAALGIAPNRRWFGDGPRLVVNAELGLYQPLFGDSTNGTPQRPPEDRND